MRHEFAVPPTRMPRPAVAVRAPPRQSPLLLQQLAGNRAFGRLQAKLTINQPGDQYEVEADRIADTVMRMPERRVQRTCACGGTCDDCQGEEEPHVQRAAITSVADGAGALAEAPACVSDVIRSHGEPLDASTRASMEARLGYDFGTVRIHRDAAALASTQAIAARAYTVGDHVVFGEQQYRPTTNEGQRLLAHELTHVVQQGAASYHSQAPVVQRDAAPSASGVNLTNVPYEKWSADVESKYRRAGLWEAANAIRNCRETGSCSKVLTESEAWTAYRSGRSSAGMKDLGPSVLAAGVAPLVVPGAAPAGGAAAESALARAAVRWGFAEVVGGGLAAETAAAPAAAAGTVIIPLAVGIYVAIAIADLIGWASFQIALQRLGYTILPAPLGVCIGLCHQPSAPAFREPFPLPPAAPLLPPKMSDEDLKRLTDWISKTAPKPTPTPTPVPVPKPKPKEDEDKNRCKLVKRTVPRGNDPLSDLFCTVVMPGASSYDIYSIMGWAEIDALAGRTWYECKCGYGSLVRAAERGDWLSRIRLDDLDEQIRRHMRIAAYCRLAYRFVVAREYVAALVRARHPDVDVIVFGWEPCE